MKKGLVLAWLLFLFSVIAFLFWRNEWKFSQPTPIPSNYHDVSIGASVTLPATASPLLAGDKPLFLHFFNPDCPCSRFNMPQFRTLVQQYGNRARFAIVVMSPARFTAEQIQSKFNLPYPIPVLSDSAIAAACGVYSTPQAVILTADRKLYYRGNYNRSRYCSDEKTGFARLALDSLFDHNFSPTFSPLALKAYGCQLPTCTR